jgi:bacillithiol system protein YtxJ
VTEDPRLDWLRAVDAVELDRLWTSSGVRPLWVVKHSTRCGASAHALLQVERFRGTAPSGDWLLVEVPRQRSLADAVARRSGIRHESPQVLLVSDGDVLWHGTPWQIEVESLLAAAQRPQPSGGAQIEM